ncbi:hypothetical protein EJJ20_01585 [Pseudomonas poae]|nr:hypothetical protein EJJ20_01585 [Pseudomonas poae]
MSTAMCCMSSVRARYRCCIGKLHRPRRMINIATTWQIIWGPGHWNWTVRRRWSAGKVITRLAVRRFGNGVIRVRRVIAPWGIRGGTGCDGGYYYGLRYYLPWLHRWANPDPLGDADGLNFYASVRNNPVTFFDKLGLPRPVNILMKKILKVFLQCFCQLSAACWLKILILKNTLSHGRPKPSSTGCLYSANGL